jgi:minor extracellular serine protease Vpr
MRTRAKITGIRRRSPAIQLLYSVVLALLLQVTVQRVALAATAQDNRAAVKALSRWLVPGSNELQLIVELSTPSLVEYLRSGGGRQAAMNAAENQIRVNLRSPQALMYKLQAAKERRALIQRLSGIPGARVEGEVGMLLNAVFVRVPPEQYKEISRLPGVRKVYFSRRYRKALDAAANLVHAQDLWSKSGGRTQAGEGVKIGIVDSGIDITHPMFDSSSFTAPSGYPKGEPSFTNNKVIVARNYIRLLDNPQTVRTAIDEDGHGTFVAGIAAGDVVVSGPLGTISGMAPGAYLGNYKVLGTPGLNTATAAAIIAAIEDAVADGMDVINLSLGPEEEVYQSPSEVPEIPAIQNAIASGVIVTISAGNTGPDTHTIPAMANAPEAITVGSVSNSRMLGRLLHVTAPVPIPPDLADVTYISGDGPFISETIPSITVSDVATLDGDGYGCSAFRSNSLSGTIALIERGGPSCTFATQVKNASAAGAKAVIIYNSFMGGGPMDMFGLASTFIPAVAISNRAGIALKHYVSAHPGAVKVGIDDSSIRFVSTTPNVMTPLSAVGPAMDFGIKPDLVAVGENIISAAQHVSPNGSYYGEGLYYITTGTSSSAPMVAGAAAILAQLHPTLKPAAIKSILTSTANQKVTVDGGNPANILEMGSGLLDMGAASRAVASFDPATLSFGTQPYQDSLTLTRAVTITNISSSTDQFALSVNPFVSGAVVSVSPGNTGPIAPGSSSTFEVKLQVSSGSSGGFQGFLAAASSATGTVYHIPYWAGLYTPDPTRILTVKRDESAGTYSTLEAALRAARPGNVIEIGDSATYFTGARISTNEEGLPLHGVTIRAAQGQTPVLDGSMTNSYAVITIDGVRNALLQGLKIRSGPIGVWVNQPSVSLPASVTVDQCTVTNSNDTSWGSITADPSGTLYVAKSTVADGSGSGIRSSGGYLTVTASTIRHNVSDGVDASSTQVQVLNSTITENTGPALNFDACSGIIDGNTISKNTGTHGDGLDLADSAFTISNNAIVSNDRAGIAFFDVQGGDRVKVSKNTLQGNAYGVWGTPAIGVLLDSNLIRDNKRGVSLESSSTALLTNNGIVRSTAGDGLEAGGTASVRIVNNTVYNNAQHGISVSPGADVQVFNSIIISNGAGDLSGLQAAKVQYSLIGDGSFVGNNGNRTGDPRFVNPATDNYSLNSGSAALDGGSNTAADLPMLDTEGRLRVAPGVALTSLPGDGIVDIGAAEANSGFPLLFPLVANGTQACVADDVVTGYALLNSGPSATTANLTAFTADGGMITGSSNPAAQFIKAGSQLPIFGFQLFGYDPVATVLGSVLASSGQPLSGFSLMFDRNFSRFSIGANPADEIANELYFPRHVFDQSGAATYTIFNPGTNPAAVSAALISAAGHPMDSLKTVTIAPKGQFAFTFDNMTASSGYVRVQSDRPVAGTEIFGKPPALGVLNASAKGSAARLFFPHIAVNQGFASLIGIINLSGSRTNLVLTAYDSTGQVLGKPQIVVLASGAQLLSSVDTLFGIPTGPLTTGYIVAEGDVSGIQGFTEFIFDDGTHNSAAAVPAESVPRQHLVFSHIAHQVPAGAGGIYLTGIGLLNPFGTPVAYTLRVFDSAGKKVAEMSDTLPPAQKIAKMLSHPVAGAGFFSQDLPLSSGHVEVDTDYGLLGFELFFTESFSQLASVPPQN